MIGTSCFKIAYSDAFFRRTCFVARCTTAEAGEMMNMNIFDVRVILKYTYKVQRRLR